MSLIEAWRYFWRWPGGRRGVFREGGTRVLRQFRIFEKKLKILKNRSSKTIWLTEGGDGRKSEDIKCKKHKIDLFYVFKKWKNSPRQFYIISVLYCGILMIYRNGYVLLRKTFNLLNCETAFPCYLRHIWTADSNLFD